MVSPSISSRTRNTPWVLGCCGPMLTTNCCAFSVMAGLSDRLVLLWRRRDQALAAGQVELPVIEVPEVLAQRPAWKAIPHEDAPRVGMALEGDAEHIIDFVLLQ